MEESDRDLAARYGYVRNRRGEDQDEDDENGGVVRKYILPAILISLGALIISTQVTWVEPEIPLRINFYPVATATIVLLAVSIAIGAVMLASHWLEYTLGNLNIAVFKIASVAVLAISIAIVLTGLNRREWDYTGATMGWSFMVVAYWVFLPILFKLEIQETLLTVGIISLINAVAMAVILAR